MCAGSLLANRELYLVCMRMLSCFEIVSAGYVDVHPVRGASDPTSLVTMPERYEVFFKPRDEGLLRSIIEEKEAARVLE